jgi:Ala-tRNA(Pro) deacylase
MPIPPRLEFYLNENQIPFTHSTHPLAFTAQEVAHAERVSGRMIAKTVVVMADGNFVMAVLPADSLVDLQELHHVLGANHVRLATERELADLFPDCELGAMPPFGNLYGLPVYLDNSLAHQPAIAFNGGTHRDIVYMKFVDFRRAVSPVLVAVGRRLAA